MTEKDILRAMSGIDATLILDAEKPHKNSSWLKWAGVAAGFFLIVYLGFMMKIAFTGANAPGPTNFYYDSFAEMNAAIGKDTLYNDVNTAFAESEIVSISISCYEDENGNVDVRDPNQLKATLTNGEIKVSYYILFGKDNVKKSYIAGYEEQRLRREINGITVHYSKIYDGSYHSQAKFVYDGDLYVIDVTSKEDIHDIQDYIDRILKEE